MPSPHICRQRFVEGEEARRTARFRTVERLLPRKPVERLEETEPGAGTGLERPHGLWWLTAIGVGGVIGAGAGRLGVWESSPRSAPTGRQRERRKSSRIMLNSSGFSRFG